MDHNAHSIPKTTPKDRFQDVANGSQLQKLTALIDAGIIHPIIDKIFPFESTAEAMQYAEKGRTKGKVVIDMQKEAI